MHKVHASTYPKCNAKFHLISEWTACGAISADIADGELVTCEMCKAEITRRVAYTIEHLSA